MNGTEIPLKIKCKVFDVKSPDQQQTLQKNGTTIALTDQNGLPTLELRLASRAGEVDEKMCAPVEEIGDEARKDDIPVVQMDHAFLHDTGDKEAKVTFLTMVDNSSGQMVATAVQKKGHDKFVERFLLEGLESSGVTGEMMLQTDKRNGTDRRGKTCGS